MALAGVLAHTAVPLRIERSTERVEGTYDSIVVEGDPIPVAFFPPTSREQGTKGREVRAPTLLYRPPHELNADDRIRLSGPGLRDVDEGEWQIDGTPQAAGKPGRTPKVLVATLKRVTP